MKWSLFTQDSGSSHAQPSVHQLSQEAAYAGSFFAAVWRKLRIDFVPVVVIAQGDRDHALHERFAVEHEPDESS
ncbi:MAG: hypothetical protein NW703_04815 [Nitrospiraceae bacterium]